MKHLGILKILMVLMLFSVFSTLYILQKYSEKENSNTQLFYGEKKIQNKNDFFNEFLTQNLDFSMQNLNKTQNFEILKPFCYPNYRIIS